jgi:hypothetical protein
MNAAWFSPLRLFRLIAALTCSMSLLVSTSITQAEAGTQSDLTAISGVGLGHVNISPTSQDQGTFAAEITLNVHDAAPNTTFFVRRAPDLVPDGNCTGPYLTNVGVSLTTSEDGAGATHFEFHRGAPFVSGVKFDVVFQVFTADGSTILQSECMTVTVK